MRAGFIGREAVVLLAQSGVPVSVTGTTLETTLASVTIPGGLIGPSGYVQALSIWQFTNNANNKSPRARLGGVIVWSTTGASSAGGRYLADFFNAGANGAQVTWNNGASPFGQGSAAIISTALDTEADQNLTLTAQLGSAGDVATLLGYSVKVYRG